MTERNLDFDRIINRKNTDCLKYDFAVKRGMPADVLPLWVADMDFETSSYIEDALVERAKMGIYGYSDAQTPYFEAVAGWMKRHHNWEPKEEWLIKTPGVVFALAMAVKAYTAPGDAVLIQSPVYYPFSEVIADNGRRVVSSTLVLGDDNRYHMDVADFEEKLKAENVKLFFLCNPHNPVGRVWTEEEIAKLGAICAKHNVIVVSDEIHSDLIFHGKKHIPTATLSPEIAANVITGISGTKTFNLAGLQASTVVFPNAHKKEVFDKFWMNMDIHRNNAFSLTAMEAAFNQGEEWLDQLLPYLSANFDYVVDYCEKRIPKIKTYAPDATYLMWLDCRELGMGNEALHDFMIRKAKLGLNDGCSFGRSLNGFMRLNAACPRATLEQAMRQLEAAVNSL